MKTSDRRAIKKAIETFNKYRSPEATAKLVSSGARSFKIEFSGPFCRTCGFHDYFDDFIIMMEEHGIKTARLRVDELENGALVEFGIKNNFMRYDQH